MSDSKLTTLASKAGPQAISMQETPNRTNKPRRPNRPNYSKIHARPLPLTTYPLPTFIPHNPLSLLHLAWTLLSQYLSPPTSHTQIYHGYFSPETRSIHVTDPKHVRALWEMGFFGKGSLSRSEPTWLEQEKRRTGLVASETSEEVTERRRRERERFKGERAKAEREALEEQRRKEGIVGPQSFHHATINSSNDLQNHTHQEGKINLDLQQNGNLESMDLISTADSTLMLPQNSNPDLQDAPVNQEHLQLSPEEAFFLAYALGALTISFPYGPKNASNNPYQLIQLFHRYSFPPNPSASGPVPDDPFLVNYVVYHHFRSLGWVVRDGIKFSVDYLLYERGPVFKHAAFALIVIPSYENSYWKKHPEEKEKSLMWRRKGRKDWTWLHCINRVQNQVVKTLVLVYVDIPSPLHLDQNEGGDVGKLLQAYKIREFCIRRWSANRSRD